MHNYRRFYMHKALFHYPVARHGLPAQIPAGLPEGVPKAGFERKFYDLGKVNYWGPQSKKKVDFNFDRTKRRLASTRTPRHRIPSTRWGRTP
jgi:anaerobic magnesium-protoporphyrin IX monomethyl ester cyclase